MAVFQGRAHGAATTAKWRTTPDQDQRKLESPLASFPPAPRQLPGVGSGGRVKRNLEEGGGESREGVLSEDKGTQIPSFLWGCHPYARVR